jgi:hypothetical protein
MSAYRDYLHADTGYSFAEYLGIELPKLEYGSFSYGGEGNLQGRYGSTKERVA